MFITMILVGFGFFTCQLLSWNFDKYRNAINDFRILIVKFFIFIPKKQLNDKCSVTWQLNFILNFLYIVLYCIGILLKLSLTQSLQIRPRHHLINCFSIYFFFGQIWKYSTWTLHLYVRLSYTGGITVNTLCPELFIYVCEINI